MDHLLLLVTSCLVKALFLKSHSIFQKVVLPPKSHYGQRYDLYPFMMTSPSVNMNLTIYIFLCELKVLFSCARSPTPSQSILFMLEVCKLHIFLIFLYLNMLYKFIEHKKRCFLKSVKRYALLLNPLARSLEELVPGRVSVQIWPSVLIRTALVASTVCIAFVLPFFGIFLKA